MKIKTICATILLGCCFLTVTANADESYRFTLNKTFQVGAAQLLPGEYKLVVGDTPKVVLTEVKTHKSIQLEAKIEYTDAKFGSTEIHSRQVDGVNQLVQVCVEGSKTRIAFE